MCGPDRIADDASGRAGYLLLCAVACVGALGFAARAFWAGQDANWDLQNYHRYAAYAFLHWRYPVDVGPAGFQGYLNPLPYLLPFWLSRTLPPLPAALALAVAQSAIVPLTWLVAGAVQRRADPWVQACATAAGVASAMTLSEIGTSFADLQIAALILGAVWALLRAAEGRTRLGWLSVAGGLTGAATGLKLTNGLFVPGLLLACGALAGSWGQRAAAAAVAAMAVGLGVALTGGAWAFYLARTFGNPLFPGLNTLFRSSSAALTDFTDPRFLPVGWRDALAYPFRIALGEHPTAEIAFSDPRLAVLALIPVALALAAVRGNPPRRALAITWLFTAGACVAWLAVFSIQRYAVALEILAGLLGVLVVAEWLPGRVARVAAFAGLAAMAGTTRLPDWWHRPWPDAYVAKPPGDLVAPAAFAVVSHPSGYWADALPEGSRFYSLAQPDLATGGILRERMIAGLAQPPSGGLWTLGADMPMGPAVRAKLAAQGLVPGKPCVRAPSLWWADTIFCRLTHAAPRDQAAADLAVGEQADFSNAGSGWVYELSGWATAGPAGTATLGDVAQLVFHPVADGRALVLALAATGPPYALAIGGQPGTAARPGAAGERAVCIRTAALGDGVIQVDVRPEDPGRPLLVRSMALRAAQPGECRDAG